MSENIKRAHVCGGAKSLVDVLTKGSLEVIRPMTPCKNSYYINEIINKLKKE